MAGSIQQTFTTSWSAINDVVITIPAPALEDDVIIVHLAVSSGAFTQNATAGWTNLLGVDNTQIAISDATAGGVLMYHVIDAAEEAASTVSWTMTDVFNVPESGDVLGTVWRDLDTAALLHTSNEAENASNITPHVLAGIPSGSITLNGGPVLTWILKDQLGTWTTPSGVSLVTSSNVLSGTALYLHDATSASGVAVNAITITPSSADEYLSLTYILTPAAGAADNFTQSPIDPIGITDSIEFGQGEADEYTDNVGITDTVDVVASMLQEEADDVGITDADIIYNTELVRTDDVGIGEHVLLAIDDVVNASSDDIGITDSVTAELALAGPTETDDIGIDDTVLVALDKVRVLTDIIGLLDSVVILSGEGVQIQENIGITDLVDVDVEQVEGPFFQNICLEFGLPVFVRRVAGVEFPDRETGVLFRDRAASLVVRDRNASLTFVNREAGLTLTCEE